MRPTDFVELIGRFVDDLGARELIEFINPLFDKQTNVKLGIDFRDGFSTLMYRATSIKERDSSSGPISSLLDAMGLNDSLSPTRTAEMISLIHVQGDANGIRGNSDAIFLFRTLEVRLKTLVELSRLSSAVFVHDRAAQHDEAGSTFVKIIIADKVGGGVDLTSTGETIIGLADLFGAMSSLFDETRQTPRISLVESGSDLEIWIGVSFGLAMVIKPLLEKAFDFYLHRREANFDRVLDSIDKGVEVVAKIDEKVELEGLDRDIAKRLKHDITTGMRTLFRNNGALKESMEAEVPKLDSRTQLLEYNQDSEKTQEEVPPPENDSNAQSEGAGDEPTP